VIEDPRHPFERDLVALIGSATVVPRVLGEGVGDPGLGEAVTQDSVASVEVVVVVRSGVEQDAA
jgi:hypothetical protein